MDQDLISKQITDLNTKIDNLAFYVNMIKNGICVNIDENTVLTRLFTQQKMYLDTRDISIAPHIMLEGYWEFETTEFLRSLMKEDTVFLDIGSNNGYYSIIAGSKIFTGKIISIEANPDYIVNINKSSSVNGLGNRMKVFNVALSDKEGEIVLSRFSDLWGSSTTRELEVKDKSTVDKTYKVKAITLDKLLKDNSVTKVDLILMDIEGFEDTAFQGMINTIKSNPQLQIVLEYSSNAYKSSADFYNELCKYFNTIQILKDNGTLEECPNHQYLVDKCANGFAMLYLSNGLQDSKKN